MNAFKANIFLVPMGIGSAVVLYLSTKSNDLFADNSTCYLPILFLLLLSFVYFTADFISMIVRYKPENKIYFLHHLVGIVSIPLVYFKHYYLVKYALAYLTYELSTPFLNISLANRKAGIHGVYAQFIEILFFITFTLVRIIFGTYLLYITVPIIYSIDYPEKYLLVLPIGIHALNLWWYNKILKMMHRKFIARNITKKN